MSIVKVVNKSPFQLPGYATPGSAAMDVRACLASDSRVVKVCPGCTVIIKTGLFFEVEPDYCIKVYARSGLSIKRNLGLANGVGVIDSDYRGELLVALHNHGQHVEMIEHGERIAQMMLEAVQFMHLVEVDQLGETDRGTGGLGSTGTVC